MSKTFVYRKRDHVNSRYRFYRVFDTYAQALHYCTNNNLRISYKIFESNPKITIVEKR